MSNMCRDEITGILKTKLDIVFGSSFNTNGLGGVLTCGVTGVKAGLSHSPVSAVSTRAPHRACLQQALLMFFWPPLAWPIMGGLRMTVKHDKKVVL